MLILRTGSTGFSDGLLATLNRGKPAGSADLELGRFDVGKAIYENDELLGTNAMEAQGKIRPTEEEVDKLGPEFRKVWLSVCSFLRRHGSLTITIGMGCRFQKRP